MLKARLLLILVILLIVPSCSVEGQYKIFSLWAVVDANKSTLYSAVPGKLGSILRKNDLRTSFIDGFKYEGTVNSPAFFTRLQSRFFSLLRAGLALKMLF